MNKQIQYTDEPMNDFRIVADFLPSPDNLQFKHNHTGMTPFPDEESADFLSTPQSGTSCMVGNA